MHNMQTKNKPKAKRFSKKDNITILSILKSSQLEMEKQTKRKEAVNQNDTATGFYKTPNA